MIIASAGDGCAPHSLNIATPIRSTTRASVGVLFVEEAILAARGVMFSSAPTQVLTPALSDEQIGVLRKTQDDLIDEMQQIADRWCARRHKTVEALYELGGSSDGGPAMTAEAWARWWRGAMQRWSEDASDQVLLVAAIATCCGNGALASADSAETEKSKRRTARRTER